MNVKGAKKFIPLHMQPGSSEDNRAKKRFQSSVPQELMTIFKACKNLTSSLYYYNRRKLPINI